MSPRDLPLIVIVGRTNVGKSTLFNRLSQTVKSITFDLHGVTRDVLTDTVEWNQHYFRIVDTGGINTQTSKDLLMRATQERARDMINKADLILFVCDGITGITSEDEALASLIHKQHKKTYLVINKADSKKTTEHAYQFMQLGFRNHYYISAQHGQGINDLLDAIVRDVPHRTYQVDEKPKTRVVILGQPNVGKSSLLNQLVKYERAIVSEVAGTTREALQEKITFYQEDILLTDTPGIRRKRAVGNEPLETLMVKSSFHALEQGNIILLLIDGSAAQLNDQELKLAFYAFQEHHKGLIILFNKHDLQTPDNVASLDRSKEAYAYFLKKITQLSISCTTGFNIGKIIPLVQSVSAKYTQWIPSDLLTMWFMQALTKSPLYKTGHQLRMHAAQQVKTGPITIRLDVNNPIWFEERESAFFDNVLRKHIDLKSVPVNFIFRKRSG